ncbi:hypothetical protein BC835DRAFT_1423316 [Cytidiella melzeri]|nr:hypothetical protein BC835DRAFT_1423316 [Cytidiella melzeri]
MQSTRKQPTSLSSGATPDNAASNSTTSRCPTAQPHRITIKPGVSEREVQVALQDNTPAELVKWLETLEEAEWGQKIKEWNGLTPFELDRECNMVRNAVLLCSLGLGVGNTGFPIGKSTSQACETQNKSVTSLDSPPLSPTATTSTLINPQAALPAPDVPANALNLSLLPAVTIPTSENATVHSNTTPPPGDSPSRLLFDNEAEDMSAQLVSVDKEQEPFQPSCHGWPD